MIRRRRSLPSRYLDLFTKDLPDCCDECEFGCNRCWSDDVDDEGNYTLESIQCHITGEDTQDVEKRPRCCPLISIDDALDEETDENLSHKCKNKNNGVEGDFHCSNCDYKFKGDFNCYERGDEFHDKTEPRFCPECGFRVSKKIIINLSELKEKMHKYYYSQKKEREHFFLVDTDKKTDFMRHNYTKEELDSLIANPDEVKF